MSNTKFTPGPWIGIVNGMYQYSPMNVDSDEHDQLGWAPVTDNNGDTLAIAVVTTLSDDVLDANANLIASAPDLYAALECALACHVGTDEVWIEEALAALKKARGES